VTDEQLEQLRLVARRFLVGAFESLRRRRVIPTSSYNPYIQVARDYFGDDIRRVEAHGDLERMLKELFPERFGEELELMHRDFPTTFTFALVNAAVARCGKADSFEYPDGEIDESIEELIDVLSSLDHKLACCRVVSHLTTATAEPVEVWGVEIVPEVDSPYPGASEGGRWDIVRRIASEIPLTGSALDRRDPFVWDRPHALLIARETFTGSTSHEGSGVLSARLERFLLVLRLLTASTTESFYEIEGASTLVASRRAEYRVFDKGFYGTMVRRTIRLDGSEGPAFEALSSLIDSAVDAGDRKHMASMSLEVALGRFASSYGIENQFERIAALATALEATLSGVKGDNDALVYKLRSRAATLLATEGDPARAIFDDVNALYALRSTLVHGGEMSRKDLLKTVAKISTVDSDLVKSRFGVAAGMAADRMREIVRRAILARLCLAESRGDVDPLWPFGSNTPVDSLLADDATRATWRNHWRERLAELGAGQAAELAEPAVDHLEEDYGGDRPEAPAGSSVDPVVDHPTFQDT
jgi:hypothetical protein